jgi:type II secretory ATPase GspE/PulE/Tfp pilus assembly ATPase PilB-like protein
MPSSDELDQLGCVPGPDGEAPRLFRTGAGCGHCNRGYRGRTGIFQLMALTPEIVRAASLDADAVQQAAAAAGMGTLWSDGLEKVFAGTTSIEELRRVLSA